MDDELSEIKNQELNKYETIMQAIPAAAPTKNH